MDEVIPEPLGGAHKDKATTAATLHDYLLRNLLELQKIHTENLLKARYDRFRAHGHFQEKQPVPAHVE